MEWAASGRERNLVRDPRFRVSRSGKIDAPRGKAPLRTLDKREERKKKGEGGESVGSRGPAKRGARVCSL